MPRKLVIAFVAVLLVTAACSRTPSGPQKYAVDVDAKSTAADKFQFSAYFPGSLTVSPGDSVKFRNRSTEAPHTVSFGIKADRSNQPPILTDAGENAAVFGPCVADESTAKLTRCDGERLPAFDGTGFWNSGVLQPKPAPKRAGDKSVTLKVAKDIDPGEYSYVCILHPLMNGTLRVVADEADRTKPADARMDGREAAEAAAASAKKLETPRIQRLDDNIVVVAAGWGDRVTAVNRFAPPKVEVESGTTVRWEIGSPYEPHTVTFESAFEVGDARGFTPGGVASGAGYDGGFANSGIFGPQGSPFEGSFELTFTEPGTYEYTCLLHAGQKGTVTVT